MQRINLTASPDQRVSAVLDSRRMTFRFRFNVFDGRWYFDLAIDDRPVVYGRRIVAQRNLIPAEVVPGRLFAWSEAQPGLDDFANGSASFFYVSEAEFKAALAA